MDDSDLLAFAPVPLRDRRDGWTAKRQYFFILGLARGFGAGKAARLLGMSRQSAYNLKARPGAEGFVAAWDAAVRRARERRFEAAGPSLGERARHGSWHPRLHRGKLIGWTHRPQNMAMMRILNRLDKQAGRLDPAIRSVDFDALLDAICPRSEVDKTHGNPPIERKLCQLSGRRGPAGGK